MHNGDTTKEENTKSTEKDTQTNNCWKPLIFDEKY